MAAAAKNNVTIVSQKLDDLADISAIKYQVLTIDRIGSVVLDTSGDLKTYSAERKEAVLRPMMPPAVGRYATGSAFIGLGIFTALSCGRSAK